MKDVVTVSHDNPIVRVEPYYKSFIIHWLIGNRCNYSCSYCPDMWHDYHGINKSLEELQSAWMKILAVNTSKIKEYEIGFLGGENILNKNFLPFLKWLNTEYKDIIKNVGFITNGTASVKYYSEIMQYCNWITFSTHSEFMDEENFFSKLLKVHALAQEHKCMIKVNIMNEPWHTDRIKDYKEFLDSKKIDNYIHPIIDYEGKHPLPIKPKTINFYDDKFIQRQEL